MFEKENKELNNEKDKKKLLIRLVAVIVLTLSIIGVSYAAWSYTFNGIETNTLSTADISLELLESDDNVINITNALPMSDAQGKAQTNYFDFVVTSKTVRDVDVDYTVTLEKLSTDSGYTLLDDNQIKLYLTDLSGNVIWTSATENVQKVSELTNYVLTTGTHSHDSTHNKVQDKYRLRVWIDSDVDASSWNSSTKYQYKFRLNVSGEEKNKYTVNISVTNGTITGDSTKRIRIGETGTFTVSANSGYGNGTVSCTNSQTATLSGTTLTTGAITNDTTCTVTLPLLTYTVSVTCIGCTSSPTSSDISHGSTGEFTITASDGYTLDGATVSCTNNQTATLSGTTLTTGAITNDTTCTITAASSGSWHYYFDYSTTRTGDCTDDCPSGCSNNYSTSVWSCGSDIFEAPSSVYQTSGQHCWCKY